MIMKMLQSNAEKAKKLLLAAVPLIAKDDWDETLEKNKVHCDRYYLIYNFLGIGEDIRYVALILQCV